MDPSIIFAIVLGLFLACIVVYLATRPRRSSVSLRAEPRADFNRREGLAIGETHPRWKDHPTLRAQKIVRLSARDLERVNIKRKLADRRPLTRGGFTHGLAVAPQHDDHSGLLAWLLIFESVQPSHYSHRCAIESGITVQPDEPYNGLGGSYGGAGASGSWSDDGNRAPSVADPDLHSLATPDLVLRDGNASSFTDRGTGQVIDERSVSNVDSVAAPTSAPTPTPTPTPTSTPDTSYSAPSDSGGGGGGGDSGGGGGGD